VSPKTWLLSIRPTVFSIQKRHVDDDEEIQFKEAAKHVLALTGKKLAELLKRDDFKEVKSE
jgi:hypothetical protein